MPGILDIGALQGRIEMQDRATSVLQQFQSNVTATSTQVNGLGRGLQMAGALLTPISAGLIGLARAGVEAATTLNAGIANVSALLTNVSDRDLPQVTMKMKSEIRSLAIEMGKDTSEITTGVYEVISSLGLTGDTFKQTEIAAKAGAAGLASTKDAFTAINAVARAYGDTSEASFRKVANLEFQTVNLGQVTFPQLAGAIGRVTPVAHIAGVSMEELFAIISTASGVTGTASQVTTQMTSAINAFLKPGAAMKQLFKELHVETGQELIQQRGLTGALQATVEYSNKTGVSILELTKRKEAFVLASYLATTGTERFNRDLGEMKSKAITAGEGQDILTGAFKRQTAGVNEVGFAWKQFKVEVQVAMEELGDVILPIVSKIGKSFRPIWEEVKVLLHAFEQLPVGIQASLILIGPMLIVAGTAIRVFSTNMAAVIELGALAWKGLTKVVQASTQAIIANAALAETAIVKSMLPFSMKGANTQVKAMEAWKVGSSELLGAQILADAAKAEQAAVKYSVLEKAWTAIKVVGGSLLGFITGPVGITAAIVAGTVVLAGYAIGWDNVWGAIKKVGGFFLDTAEEIGEVTGATKIFMAIWNDTKTVVSELGETLLNVGRTMKNNFLVEWYTAKTAVIGFVDAVKKELVLNLLIADAMFSKLTGSIKGSFLAALADIAVEVLVINTPLRDFLALLAGIESRLPSWAKNAKDAADSSDKLAVQAGLAYGAMRNQIEGFDGGAASLSLYDSNTKKAVVTVSTWDSILQKNTFNLNDSSKGYYQFGTAVKSAKEPVEDLTEKLKEYREEIANLGKDGAPTATALAQAIKSHAFDPKELLAWSHLSEGALKLFQSEMNNGVAAAKKFKTAQDEIAGATTELTEAQKEYVRSGIARGATDKKIADAMHANVLAVGAYRDELKELKTVTDDVYKVSTKLADLEDVEDKKFLVDYIRQNIEHTATSITNFQKLSEEMDERILQSRMTTSQKTIRQWTLERNEAINNLDTQGVGYERLKGEINAYYQNLIDKETRDETFKLRMQKIQAFSSALHELAQFAGKGLFGDIVKGATGFVDQFGKMAEATHNFQELQKTATDKGQSMWKDYFAQTAQYAVSWGITVAGIAMTAVSMIEKFRDVLNATTYNAAVSARGGADAIRNAGSLAGFNVEPLLNATKTKEFQRQLAEFDKAVQASNDRMQKYGLTWRDFGTQIQKANISTIVRGLIKDFNTLKFQGVAPTNIIKGMSGDLNQLVIDAVATGQKIPVALQPMIQSLIQSGQLSEQAARALLGMGAEAVPTYAEVQAAAARYGIELDGLGPKIKSLQIADTATHIVADFKLITSAGGDVNATLQGMSDEVQTVINDAARAGVGIPESMKPIIKQMIDLGLLTDGFGNKLTDVGELKWDKPLSSAIDDLTKALRDLIDWFSKVGDAAEEAGRRAAGGIATGVSAVPRGGVPDPGTPTTGTPAPSPAPAPGPSTPTPAPAPAPSPAPPPSGGAVPRTGVLPGPETSDPRKRFATGGMVPSPPVYYATGTTSVAKPKVLAMPAPKRLAAGGVVPAPAPAYYAAGSTSAGTVTGSLGHTASRSTPIGAVSTYRGPGSVATSTPVGAVSTYRGGGPQGTDTVNAWLTPKEGVVTVAGMKELTESNLQLLNTKPGAFTAKMQEEGAAAATAKILPFIQQQQQVIAETQSKVSAIGDLIGTLLRGFQDVLGSASSGLGSIRPGDVRTPPSAPRVSDSGNIEMPEGWRPGQVPEGADPRMRFATGGVVPSTPPRLESPTMEAPPPPRLEIPTWHPEPQQPAVVQNYARMFEGMTVTVEALPEFMERLADVLDMDGDLRQRMRYALQVKKSA